MHTFLCGICFSGKSFCMRCLAADWLRRGFSPMVCDPKGGKWPTRKPGHVFLTAAPMMELLKRSERVPFFVDECGLTIGHGKQADDLQWLAVTSRGHGHLGHFACQGFTQIPPIYRDQCTRGYVFKQSPKNAVLLAEHFSDDALLAAPSLTQGEYFYVESFKPTVRRRIAA